MKNTSRFVQSIIKATKNWKHHSKRRDFLKKQVSLEEDASSRALKLSTLKIEVLLLKHAGEKLKKFLARPGKPFSLQSNFKDNAENLSYIIFWTITGEYKSESYVFLHWLLTKEQYLEMKSDIQEVCTAFKIKHRYYKKSGMTGFGCVKFYLKKKY